MFRIGSGLRGTDETSQLSSILTPRQRCDPRLAFPYVVPSWKNHKLVNLQETAVQFADLPFVGERSTALLRQKD